MFPSLLFSRFRWWRGLHTKSDNENQTAGLLAIGEVTSESSYGRRKLDRVQSDLTVVFTDGFEVDITIALRLYFGTVIPREGNK